MLNKLFLILFVFGACDTNDSSDETSLIAVSVRSHSNCSAGETCFYDYNLENYDYGQPYHICAYEFHGVWGEEIQIDPYESDDFIIEEDDDYLEITISNNNDFTYMLDIYWKYDEEDIDC